MGRLGLAFPFLRLQVDRDLDLWTAQGVFVVPYTARSFDIERVIAPCIRPSSTGVGGMYSYLVLRVRLESRLPRASSGEVLVIYIRGGVPKM